MFGVLLLQNFPTQNSILILDGLDRKTTLMCQKLKCSRKALGEAQPFTRDSNEVARTLLSSNWKRQAPLEFEQWPVMFSTKLWNLPGGATGSSLPCLCFSEIGLRQSGSRLKFLHTLVESVDPCIIYQICDTHARVPVLLPESRIAVPLFLKVI